MSFTIQSQQAGDVAILQCHGRIVRGEPLVTLKTGDNRTQLKLVNPNAFVREMLDRTRLTCVFDIASVDDAVEILCDEVAAAPMHAVPQFAMA